MLKLTFLSLFLLSGCSLFGNRKALFESEVEKQDPPNNQSTQVVPKSQYDDLLRKYEDLKRNHERVQTQGLGGTLPANKMLSGLKGASQLDSTVDVFNSKKTNSGQKPMVYLNQGEQDLALENQITELRQAKDLLSRGQTNAGMEVLKRLEGSPFKQVKVRAKFTIAEVLFQQKEYDLAMQQYETIVGQYSFSGVVLKTLGRLIVCSEKLKLEKKKDQYYSILHDFFGES